MGIIGFYLLGTNLGNSSYYIPNRNLFNALPRSLLQTSVSH